MYGDRVLNCEVAFCGRGWVARAEVDRGVEDDVRFRGRGERDHIEGVVDDGEVVFFVLWGQVAVRRVAVAVEQVRWQPRVPDRKRVGGMRDDGLEVNELDGAVAGFSARVVRKRRGQGRVVGELDIVAVGRGDLVRSVEIGENLEELTRRACKYISEPDIKRRVHAYSFCSCKRSAISWRRCVAMKRLLASSMRSSKCWRILRYFFLSAVR